MLKLASVAQSVVHLTRNEKVACSSQVTSSNKTLIPSGMGVLLWMWTDSNQLNATVRWTVARDGSTERNNNFLTRKCRRTPAGHQKSLTPNGVGDFCRRGFEEQNATVQQVATNMGLHILLYRTVIRHIPLWKNIEICQSCNLTKI